MKEQTFINPLTQPSVMQTAPSVTLSALLNHPEFRSGVSSAHEHFTEAFEPAPLSEAEVVDSVLECLNEDELITEEDSVYFLLGYVVGTIDRGLSYAQSEEVER